MIKNNALFDSFFEDHQEDTQPSIKKIWIDFEQAYTGFPYKLPCIQIKGKTAGAKLLVTATIHGDELNGIAILHSLVEHINPHDIAGEIIILPVVNILAFHIQSRYLPDRRDLNRLFPGSRRGSEGARLASFIWTVFGQKATAIVDLHSASYNRWNFPHIRGNMEMEKVREMTKAFGADVATHSTGTAGSLRRVASKVHIPSILFEAGQINRFEKEFILPGMSGIWGVMHLLQMVDKFPSNIPQPKKTFSYLKNSSWVRAKNAGLFDPFCKPGDNVKKGEVIGRITSLLGEETAVIHSRLGGTILGYNLHPQVTPGRALYHIAYNEQEL